SKAEPPQPQRRDDQLECPDREDNADLPGALDLTEEAETVAVKDGRADQCVHEVVCKGHLTDGSKGTREGAKPGLLPHQHDQANQSQTDDDAGPVVELAAKEPRVDGVPIFGNVAVYSI